MSFLNAFIGLVSSRSRVQAYIDNFLETYRSLAAQNNAPPCVTLYETWMSNTEFGVKPQLRSPVLVTGLASVYSCISPPGSAIALAHQFCMFAEPKQYRYPTDPNPVELLGILQHLLDTDGLFDLALLKDAFFRMHGTHRLSHPENSEMLFEISDATFRTFRTANESSTITLLIRPAVISAEEYVQKIRELIYEKNYGGALKLSLQAERQYPDSLEVLFWLSETYSCMHDFEKGAEIAMKGFLKSKQTHGGLGTKVLMHFLEKILSALRRGDSARALTLAKQGLEWAGGVLELNLSTADRFYAEKWCGVLHLHVADVGEISDMNPADVWWNRFRAMRQFQRVVELRPDDHETRSLCDLVSQSYYELIARMGFADHAEAIKALLIRTSKHDERCRDLAEQSDANARLKVCDIYESSRGVDKVIKSYRKAADDGKGEKDAELDKLFVKQTAKAAEQGDADAQYMLGLAYENGESVGVDYVQAYAYFTLAEKSNDNAAKARDALNKKMSPEQIAEAQKRTKELRARIKEP